jgi:hypothetical protein
MRRGSSTMQNSLSGGLPEIKIFAPSEGVKIRCFARQSTDRLRPIALKNR